MQWCAETEKVCVCVCVCESGFVEDAFVCFKMWFCLVFNILLYCHIIDKSDRRKWRITRTALPFFYIP